MAHFQFCFLLLAGVEFGTDIDAKLQKRFFAPQVRQKLKVIAKAARLLETLFTNITEEAFLIVSI